MNLLRKLFSSPRAREERALVEGRLAAAPTRADRDRIVALCKRRDALDIVIGDPASGPEIVASLLPELRKVEADLRKIIS